MNNAVILAAVRTPIGKFQGGLSGLKAPELGAQVIRAAVQRAGLLRLDEIDEVLMGNVVTAGEGQAPARQAAIQAGLPESVGATTINKVCGSGLKAIMLAAQAVRAGDGQLFVAGGMESMSRAPFLVDARNGELRYGHAQLTDALLHDGLWCSLANWGMGDAAEFIANEYGVTRAAMDEFACASHSKAIAAIDAGKLKAEITAVEVPGRRGETKTIEADESPRRDTCIETLSKVSPSFKKDGQVTAGNASGLSDGAAAVIVASQKYAHARKLAPLARIVGYTQAAVDPQHLFIAPALAIPRLLTYTGWTLEDVDLIELNEAFAAQMLADGVALASLGWDWDKVNVHGGAIALGHPIGASGARLVATLIYALKDRHLHRGIVALCLGGAEAVALAIEIE
jgi:acetyl-CoA C-acetyltransferase